MAPNYKPENYNTVSPYLIIGSAAATIDFLEDVFDAVELRRFANEAGGIMHAEVRIGDSVIMLADSGEGWPSVPAHVHVYVPDVDAAYERALNAGAATVQAPVKKDDADRRAGVMDAGGTTWWMATRVE